jgi:hypothetical protein
MTSTPSRVIYPELPDPLTPGGLQQLFSPSFDERKWAPSVARIPVSQVALLVHLKIFQTIGRFLPAAEVPLTAIEHVARRMGVETGTNLIFSDRTLYRHRPVILKRLNVVSWGPEARTLAETTMRRTAHARTDPADIINSAIDALIRHGFELPALVGPSVRFVRKPATSFQDAGAMPKITVSKVVFTSKCSKTSEFQPSPPTPR